MAHETLRPADLSPDLMPHDGADATTETRRRLPQLDHQLVNPEVRKLYDLPTSPEFLFQEDALRTHRSMGENLTFYTGIGFCSGTLTGGALGAFRGVRAAERGETAKLRVNRALNECGSVGKKFGNRLGVVGFLFAGTESLVRSQRNGTDDWINTVSGAVGAGAIYGLPAGLRAVAVHSVVGGVLAGACVAAKPLLRKYAPDFAARMEYLR